VATGKVGIEIEFLVRKDMADLHHEICRQYGFGSKYDSSVDTERRTKEAVYEPVEVVSKHHKPLAELLPNLTQLLAWHKKNRPC